MGIRPSILYLSAELLDRPGMAARISVSVPTFDRLSRRPGFPKVTVIRGKPLYNPVRVVAWLERQSRKSEPTDQ